MKKQSIEKYSSMIVEHSDMLCCEFGAYGCRITSEDNTVYLIWLEDNFQSLETELECQQVTYRIELSHSNNRRLR